MIHHKFFVFYIKTSWWKINIINELDFSFFKDKYKILYVIKFKIHFFIYNRVHKTTLYLTLSKYNKIMREGDGKE